MWNEGATVTTQQLDFLQSRHFITFSLLTTSFTPQTYHASSSAASFAISLFTTPFRVTTQFLVVTFMLLWFTSLSFSRASTTASVISSSESSSGGVTSRLFITSALPGTHHARTPARRLWLKDGTVPSKSTIPLFTSTSIVISLRVGSSRKASHI